MPQFVKLIRMICISTSGHLSSKLVGVVLVQELISSAMLVSKSANVIKFKNIGMVAWVKRLYLVLYYSGFDNRCVRLMWIIWVCCLQLTVNIGFRHRGGVALLCSSAFRTTSIVFGWCMLLVSVVSVKRIKSTGMLWTCLACASCFGTAI